MGLFRLRSPFLWLAVPLALVLIAAIACGGEEPTAVPSNTPVPAAPTDTPGSRRPHRHTRAAAADRDVGPW